MGSRAGDRSHPGQKLDDRLQTLVEKRLELYEEHEFRPTLERRRDDAAETGQVGRLMIFDGLLEQQAS